MTEIAELAHEVRSLRSEVSRMLGTRLTKNQLADRLGISRRTLYNRIASGSIPWPKSDGKWLLSDVIEWETKAARQAD